MAAGANLRRLLQVDAGRTCVPIHARSHARNHQKAQTWMAWGWLRSTQTTSSHHIAPPAPTWRGNSKLQVPSRFLSGSLVFASKRIATPAIACRQRGKVVSCEYLDCLTYYMMAVVMSEEERHNVPAAECEPQIHSRPRSTTRRPCGNWRIRPTWPPRKSMQPSDQRWSNRRRLEAEPSDLLRVVRGALWQIKNLYAHWFWATRQWARGTAKKNGKNWNRASATNRDHSVMPPYNTR